MPFNFPAMDPKCPKKSYEIALFVVTGSDKGPKQMVYTCACLSFRFAHPQEVFASFSGKETFEIIENTLPENQRTLEKQWPQKRTKQFSTGTLLKTKILLVMILPLLHLPAWQLNINTPTSTLIQHCLRQGPCYIKNDVIFIVNRKMMYVMQYEVPVGIFLPPQLENV